MGILEIPLTQGKVAIIDEADWPLVRGYRWRATKSTRTYYASATVAGTWPHKTALMHRVILGLDDSSIEGDHRDGDGLNNRRSNLRVATKLQNRRNKRLYRNSRSGFKGVKHNPNLHPLRQWIANIKANGRMIYLGAFGTKEEAAMAYDRAAILHFGDFAHLNFPAQNRRLA